LEIWNGTDANKIHGTDGRQFVISPPADQNLTIFIDTLYRHSQFWFNMTHIIKDIEMRIYWVDPTSGYNQTLGGYSYDLYGPQGINNMTGPETKIQGTPVPVFISLPYFFHSDKYYLNRINFLSPYQNQSQELYNTMLFVEPISGINMASKKRIQINIKLSSSFIKTPHFPNDEIIDGIVFPVAWFSLESTISDKLAKEFRDKVYIAVAIREYLPLGAGILSGLLFLIAASLFGLFLYRQSKRNGYTPLADQPDVQ